jgi:hypothetical protein
VPNHHIRANPESRAIHTVSESLAQPYPAATAAICNAPCKSQMVPATKSGQDASFSKFGGWHLFPRG